MNIALWIVQGLLAFVYGFAGGMKTFNPDFYRNMPKGAEFAVGKSDGYFRSIGIPEILGALGMILPMVTGILPWLTPLAAVGLTVIQLLALFAVHLPKKEPIVPNIILGALSVFIVVGRWGLFS
ncbi:MAG TPA: DoxX family protein [Anaerolineales bacterium]|nr:DoxX family protein [Anaerolineales bacterium]